MARWFRIVVVTSVSFSSLHARSFWALKKSRQGLLTLICLFTYRLENDAGGASNAGGIVPSFVIVEVSTSLM